MTVFDVIRYPVTNIYDWAQLDPIPESILKKWRTRAANYAIERAESVAHLDTTGNAQLCLYTAKKFINGEIDVRAAIFAIREVWHSDINNPPRAAYWAAYSAIHNIIDDPYHAGYVDRSDIISSAIGGVAWAELDVGGQITDTYAVAKELFHKWLIEEIANYET